LTDTTQGQDAPSSDGTLFREALDAPTLEKFENPPPSPPEKPPEQQQQRQPEKPPEQPDAPVPSGRFREESEARRRAERERDDLRARLAAFEVQPRQQQQPQQKPDVFDNPSAFVKSEVAPLIDQFRNEIQMTRELMSRDNAVRVFGEEKVAAAHQALADGMNRHDPNAHATWQRAMNSHDPYGVITKWHQDREVLTQIGGDLSSYRAKILEEAMKDPEFQKKVIQSAKGQAQANGSQINRPAVTQSTVPVIPSLADIGAAGPDEQVQEPSDDALFRAAVSAKRR
jgi:hypothetical protein